MLTFPLEIPNAKLFKLKEIIYEINKWKAEEIYIMFLILQLKVDQTWLLNSYYNY